MPPRARFSKEEIVQTAVDIVRKSGVSSLTARNLGKELGTSSSPIFTVFDSMDSVKNEVLKVSYDLYNSYLVEDMKSDKYPKYKASGMAYIRFAQEEKELFKFLFMRNRTGEDISKDREAIKPIIQIIMKNTGLDEEIAYEFHEEMWIFVHGIATMIATNYLEWNADSISKMLTDMYFGLRTRFIEEGK